MPSSFFEIEAEIELLDAPQRTVSVPDLSALVTRIAGTILVPKH